MTLVSASAIQNSSTHTKIKSMKKGELSFFIQIVAPQAGFARAGGMLKGVIYYFTSTF